MVAPRGPRFTRVRGCSCLWSHREALVSLGFAAAPVYGRTASPRCARVRELHGHRARL